MSWWSHVDERLPKDGQRVIIAILFNPTNVPAYYSTAECYYKGDEQSGSWWEGDHSLIAPTHWMPWPESPEVGEI